MFMCRLCTIIHVYIIIIVTSLACDSLSLADSSLVEWESITGYGSTLYIGIAMVFVFQVSRLRWFRDNTEPA